MTVSYQDHVDNITVEQLRGDFFVGWGKPVSSEKHLQILQGSSYVILAIDDDNEQVVGFVTAISDGVLAAFIPLLEVLESHQAQGIGSELVRQMLAKLQDLYSIDLICDAELNPFYERFGMQSYNAMLMRNYDQL